MYSAEEIVLAVHRQSEVVPYLEQRLEARDVSARYAAGTPLSRTGPVRLLQAVADYLNDSTFQALAALLRHPDTGPLTGSTAAVAAGLEAIEVADRYFADHLPFRVRGEIPRGHQRAALFPPVVRAIEREGPLRAFGGRKPLSEWMPVVMDVLLTAYGESELDRSRPSHRRQLDALGHIHAVAASLSALPQGLDETCSGSEAIRMLLVELRDEALPPDPGRDAVELLDWLELPLDDAPIVILTGFNEGFLPESLSAGMCSCPMHFGLASASLTIGAGWQGMRTVSPQCCTRRSRSVSSRDAVPPRETRSGPAVSCSGSRKSRCPRACCVF